MNLFEKIKPNAHLSRNGFDLSSRQIFSAKAGQLLPILTHEVVPNDYFEIDMAALARTMPLNRSSYVRMKQYFHFFFVPYQQLWSNWNTFISQRYNPVSSRDYEPNSGSDNVHTLGAPYFNFKRYFDRFVVNGDTSSWPDCVQDFDGEHRNFFNQSGLDEMCKLMDYLGYGGAYLRTLFQSNDATYQTFAGDFDKNLSVFRFLAYNKIFYDFYSNPYYDFPDPRTFNADLTSLYVPGTTPDSSGAIYNPDMTNWLVPSMFTLKYRRWPNDYFMGLLPSSQFGEVVTVGFNNIQISASPIVEGQTNRNVRVTNNGLLGYGTNQATQGVLRFNSDAISMLDLRYAEQLQKWRETTMRAGRRFKDQTKAHYGVEPHCCNDDAVKYLGGFSSSINIDEVISTAGTSEAGLGDLAGKGIGALEGHKLKFKNDGDFGLIMCIYSVVPQSDYNSFGFDKANTLQKRFEFWTPEFDNLGLEATPATELSVRQGAGPDIPILGYNVRNAYLKTGIDKVHDAFITNCSLSAWTAPRYDLLASIGLVNTDFYINPKIFDSIFVEQANSRVDTDQFYVNSYFDIKAIRSMSVIGLPF